MYSFINKNADKVVASVTRDFVTEYSWLIQNAIPSQIGTPAYQKRYRKYWSMNLSQLSPDFFLAYFRILAKARREQIPLDRIVNYLYEASTRMNGQKSVQFSFATKLLHMTDQHLPVYDSQVAEFYFFQAPTRGSFEERLAALTEFYEYLRVEYARVLKNGLLSTAIKAFRREFPENKFTDEKIIDSLIWAFIKLLRSRQIDYC
jgi:hypothetical protein